MNTTVCNGIKTFDYMETDSEEKDILMSLTSVMIREENDQIKKSHDQMKSIKQDLINKRDMLKTLKSQLINKEDEYKRSALKNSILKKIIILKDEGQLVGNNMIKILQLIETMDKRSLKSLKKIEDQLLLYTPVAPRVVYS